MISRDVEIVLSFVFNVLGLYNGILFSVFSHIVKKVTIAYRCLSGCLLAYKVHFMCIFLFDTVSVRIKLRAPLS